jgi:hypothetical protein
MLMLNGRGKGGVNDRRDHTKLLATSYKLQATSY